jgi:hypothetical protein
MAVPPVNASPLADWKAPLNKRATKAHLTQYKMFGDDFIAQRLP